MRAIIRNAILALALAAAGAPVAASAALIIDTGAPVANGGGWSLNSSQYLASKFQLNADTTVTRIEGFIGGDGGTFHIGLADGGQAPSNTLQSAGVYLTKQAGSSVSDGDWFGANVNWTLTAGSYWVYFAVLPAAHPVNREGVADTLDGYMPDPAPSPLGDEASICISCGGGWHDADYIDIGVRIYDNSVASAPEPASWALMIAGFGLAGATLRRRPRAVAGR